MRVRDAAATVARGSNVSHTCCTEDSPALQPLASTHKHSLQKLTHVRPACVGNASPFCCRGLSSLNEPLAVWRRSVADLKRCDTPVAVVRPQHGWGFAPCHYTGGRLRTPRAGLPETRTHTHIHTHTPSRNMQRACCWFYDCGVRLVALPVLQGA